jgi:hypothetical protein
MKIEKEIDLTIEIELSDKDIHKYIEDRLFYIDDLYSDENKEKMKSIKAQYYQKWVELYFFMQHPELALAGKDPVPEGGRIQAMRFFGIDV